MGSIKLSSLFIQTRRVYSINLGKKAATKVTVKTGDYGTLMTSIDKLFTQKPKFFVIPESNKTSIIEVIIKLCVKSWIEHVRMCVITQDAYQVIKQDVAVIKKEYQNYFQDERGVLNLLDEVLASSLNRVAL